MSGLLSDIEAVARECGKILLGADYSGVEIPEEDIDDKEGAGNIVTVYDKRSQDFLKKHLSRILPEAIFVGEEGEDSKKVARRGYTFIVDPIDGTYNFAKEYAQSAISIGLLKDAEPYIGVCYDPYKGDMYSARKGEGAYLNGKRIHVSDRKLSEGVFMAGSAPYYRELREDTIRVFGCLYRVANDYRRSGSAVLDLCNVACGRFEGFFEMRLQPWDYAAAATLLPEAGGLITDLDGNALQFEKPTSVLATNGVEDYRQYL